MHILMVQRKCVCFSPNVCPFCSPRGSTAYLAAGSCSQLASVTFLTLTFHTALCLDAELYCFYIRDRALVLTISGQEEVEDLCFWEVP